jgi:hypothetical protein
VDDYDKIIWGSDMFDSKKLFSISIFFILMLLSAVTAEACIDYQEWFCPISRTELANEVGDLEVIDSVAYIAGAYGAFQIFDVSTPESPVLLGATSTAANGFYLTVAGEIALLGCSYTGLQILDISDPGSPGVISTLPTPDNARGSVVIGDYAFVACSNDGISVVDISNPALPSIVSTLPVGGNAFEVGRYNDYIWVSCANGSLVLIDVTVPTAPVIAGTTFPPGVVNQIVFQGTVGFAACNEMDLQILDFSDPINPTVIGSYDLPGYGLSVAVENNFVFLGSWETQMIWQFGGVRVFDVTDLSAPVIIGSMEMAWGVESLALDGEYLVVGDHREGLNILWAADPYSPYEAIEVLVPGADRVAVSGAIVCVSSTYNGLVVLEQGFMPEPEMVATYEPAAGNPADVAIVGDYAVLACSYDGLHILDLTQTGELPLFASAPIPGSTKALAVVGNLVYVTSSYNTLSIVDLSNPAVPDVLASIDDVGSNWGIAANQDLAVIAGDHLVVVDVSNPDSPDILANISLPNTAIGVDLYGEIACVAWEQELWFYDISNPALPVLVGSLATPGESQDVVVEGDMAYVSDGYGGVQVIYLNPEGDGPYWYGSFDSDGYAYGICVDDNFVYIADSGYLRMVQSQCPITVAAVEQPDDRLANRFDFAMNPNPCMGATAFSFQLPSAADVSVAIIDPSGRLVREIALTGLASGGHVVQWDGRDKAGVPCGPGLYLARLSHGANHVTGKVLILR